MIRLTTCCFLLGFALPCLAVEPGAFRFSKDIDRGDSPAKGIAAVTLDADVYAAARSDYADVRIFDSKGKETPYVLEKAVEPRMHKVRETCPSRAVSLKEHGDRLEIVVSLDEKSPEADGLTVVTPLKNYERSVRIFGHAGGDDWTELNAEGLIFDYSRYMDLDNREIRLPKNSHRKFRIEISGLADLKESPYKHISRTFRGDKETQRTEDAVLNRQPFRIDRIELWREKEEKLSEIDKRVAYPLIQWEAKEDAENKQTVVEVTTRREPLTELTLETSSSNFSRSVAVQKPVVRANRTKWIEIGRGTISRIEFGDTRKESLSIPFPEHRETTYRMVIRNEDNPPLEITGVAALGNVYRAVFLAADGETYRLGYGVEKIQRPSYDAAAVLTPLRRTQPIEKAALGLQIANPTPTPPVPSFLEQMHNPWVLGAIVVMLVALLGYALFHAARRIKELPEEP